jgi:hypothetical protein
MRTHLQPAIADTVPGSCHTVPGSCHAVPASHHPLSDTRLRPDLNPQHAHGVQAGSDHLSDHQYRVPRSNRSVSTDDLPDHRDRLPCLPNAVSNRPNHLSGRADGVPDCRYPVPGCAKPLWPHHLPVGDHRVSRQTDGVSHSPEPLRAHVLPGASHRVSPGANPLPA